VAILKVFRVEMKALDGRFPLLAIPSVTAEHAADVEQH
jgi:hypothetical protein